MIVRLIVEGKVKDKLVKSFVDEYIKRLQPFFKMEVLELGSNNKILEKKILLSSKSNSILIGMDSKGSKFNSESFSKWFNIKCSRYNNINFIIGEANGLSELVKNNVVEYISLSDMTMSYRVSLMVMAEQIYRAITIITSHPYHK